MPRSLRQATDFLYLCNAAKRAQLNQILAIKEIPLLDIGVQFLGAIERLIDSGDNALRSRENNSNWKGAITATLARMRDIGEALDPLKAGLRGRPAKAIHSLLTILFDGPYLWLSRPDGTEQEWIAARDQTRLAASLLSVEGLVSISDLARGAQLARGYQSSDRARGGANRTDETSRRSKDAGLEASA